MARISLATICGERITITGRFVSCGNIAHHKTMLLRNIKDEKNKNVSDHMWITLKDFQSGMKFRRNKLVKITGEVIKYRGFDGANFAIDPEIIEI